MISRNPFGGWLRLELLAASADGVGFALPWRDEFAGMAQGGFIHGGVLAALVDACGSYAVTAQVLRPAPTVDLVVDYHRRGTPGDFRATGRVIRLGRRLATAETTITDAGGQLIASGRGKYVADMDAPGP